MLLPKEHSQQDGYRTVGGAEGGGQYQKVAIWRPEVLSSRCPSAFNQMVSGPVEYFPFFSFRVAGLGGDAPHSPSGTHALAVLWLLPQSLESIGYSAPRHLIGGRVWEGYSLVSRL